MTVVYGTKVLTTLITPVRSFTSAHADSVLLHMLSYTHEMYIFVITDKWIFLHHSSSVALCPDPPPIDFGSVTSTGNSIGDTATYTCDPGYELVGPSVTTCDKLPTDPSMAAFQPDPPFCHREYCMNFSELLYGLIV